MNFSFDGAYIMPGQLTERLTWENTFWFGDRALQQWTGVVLSGASRDTGNTSYTTILRSGLLLGRVTATNKIKEWNPTGTDGSEQIFGVLDLSVNTQRLGANQDRWLAYVMVGGTLKADRLIIPGNTSMGIDGDTLEHLIRAQMYRRFIFSDDWNGNMHGGFKAVRALSAAEIAADAVTVTDADNNILFSNRGADALTTYTLPATPLKGLHFGFYVADADGLKISAGTADTLIVNGDATADTIQSTKIGTFFEVFGDGTGWMVIESNCIAQAAATLPTTLTVGTLGGTANGAMETVGATNSGDVSGAIMNNFQELFTQVNNLIAAVGSSTTVT